MKYKKVTIRPARPKDAWVAARLMYYASANYALVFFGKSESNAIRVLARMFPLPGHLSSYTYTFVAEDEGNAVGLLCSLDGKSWRVAGRASWMYVPIWFFVARPWQMSTLMAAMNDFEKALPPVLNEEYYVEFLAVLPERRGQGIGNQLMEFAESQARAKKLKRVLLDVEIENEGARRFYERLGFQEAKIVNDYNYCQRFGFQGSIRVVKPLAGSENRFQQGI